MTPIDPFRPGSAPTRPGQPWTVEPAERFAIIDTLTAIAAGSDHHDWSRVRAAFADQVTVDYTSLWAEKLRASQ